MKKENKMLVFVFALTLIAGLMLSTIPTVYATGANPGVSLNVGNSAPVIVAVGTKTAEDPTYCDTTSIGALWVNVTDVNGPDDLNLANCYINYTYGATTHQAGTCVEVSNGTDWINISCTGATFNFYDTAGVWNITFYVEDDAAASDTNDTTNMTYNEAVHANISQPTITFGSLTAGTNNNENTNSPDIFIRNCGNTIINTNITGAAITDGGVNSIGAGNFSIDNTTGGPSAYEMALTTSSQQFTPFDNLAVGAASNNTVYWYVDVPVGQPAATYNVGTWTITPSKS